MSKDEGAWVRVKSSYKAVRIYSLISKISACLLIGRGDASLQGEFGSLYTRTGFRIVSYYQYALVCIGIFATCRWMAGNGYEWKKNNESMLKTVIA